MYCLAQDRKQRKVFVKTVMNIWVLYTAGNFLSSCTTGSFSRRISFMELVSLVIYVWTKNILFPSRIPPCGFPCNFCGSRNYPTCWFFLLFKMTFRIQLSVILPEDEDRIQFWEYFVLNKKNKGQDNIQELNNCFNIQSSQTPRS
jgi:hypothetical protein